MIRLKTKREPDRKSGIQAKPVREEVQFEGLRSLKKRLGEDIEKLRQEIKDAQQEIDARGLGKSHSVRILPSRPILEGYKEDQESIMGRKKTA